MQQFLNRQDNASRKYILVEQGEYFSRPFSSQEFRKSSFAFNWLAVNRLRQMGISHCFKAIKLEKLRRDTLNNLQPASYVRAGRSAEHLPQQAKDDYLLNYLLTWKAVARCCRWKTSKKPFDYTLNVAVDSAGAFEPRKIDLVRPSIT